MDLFLIQRPISYIRKDFNLVPELLITLRALPFDRRTSNSDIR